jgi:hypothetical protein
LRAFTKKEWKPLLSHNFSKKDRQDGKSFKSEKPPTSHPLKGKAVLRSSSSEASLYHSVLFLCGN